ALNSAIADMPMELQTAAYLRHCAEVPERRWVSGDHYSMLLRPWVEDTAAELLAHADAVARLGIEAML
ncbi:MAG TPA: hypothetical protein VHK90_13785, partial [Thermoanaerobaculia bacterium]|nr:hypothetical protein [Thermoanaerobaculia bacterium]